MRFQEKLHQYSKEEIWEEYCSFLTLTPEEFMHIQNRLLEEQIELWSSSGIGQSILKGKYPRTIEEFREMVPLTTYEDYAPMLLSKQTQQVRNNGSTYCKVESISSPIIKYGVIMCTYFFA